MVDALCDRLAGPLVAERRRRSSANAFARTNSGNAWRSGARERTRLVATRRAGGHGRTGGSPPSLATGRSRYQQARRGTRLPPASAESTTGERSVTAPAVVRCTRRSAVRTADTAPPRSGGAPSPPRLVVVLLAGAARGWPGSPVPRGRAFGRRVLGAGRGADRA